MAIRPDEGITQGGWTTARLTVKVIKPGAQTAYSDPVLVPNGARQATPQAVQFHNFDIAITRATENYRVHVNAPVGGTNTSFRLAFLESDWRQIVTDLSIPSTQSFHLDFRPEPPRAISQAAQRPVQTYPTAFDVKRFGESLYHSLFSSVTGIAFKKSLDYIAVRKHGLRIRLKLDEAPELYRLPWELLYDAEGKNFLALTPNITLLRASNTIPQPTKTPFLPLRVLIVGAQPEDLPSLDIEKEIQQITELFDKLSQTNRLQTVWDTNVSLEKLTACIRDNEFHIFHYIGHADPSHEQSTGGLLLTDDSSRHAVRLPLNQLASMLSQKSLRLVVLDTDLLGVYAHNMVLRHGIPALVAHQFKVSNHSRLVLATRLYHELANGSQLDVAIAQARQWLSLESQGQSESLDWASVLLHTGSSADSLYGVFESVVASDDHPAQPA